MDHMSSASHGVICLGTHPTVIEEHTLTADISIASVEQTSKNFVLSPEPRPVLLFRCAKILETKGANEEEGIYRLGCSLVHIRVFKERFNTQGDYNLIKSSKTDFHDVHAVAGSLKHFLRNLDSLIHTRVPLIMNSPKLLMTKSCNVGIIFRPTLGMPAPLFALLL
ncbi:uncharacterized protein MELLADRAFT_95672 [Melampsora larici-populina 98AG31]|uniref:Rho-GAP domain-containing protein n=1 Tax=Melampsora larici-populina (strain 98AG31 / pathotype 3-4-7) TaxID=747676 RepID=F4SA69_MELLP|nr:uncharacterized protein MELLADRAFT_95672 [Melampsora larici-populina 98AG31]EGF98458.1 hypothetical protein MELLADRAFT_95672 [Melampsora larici-populina 98AG31]